MIIYKATNLVNGKIYIGQTTRTLQERKKSHNQLAKRGTPYFRKAIIKYGINNFKWQVICICPNIDSLNDQEQYYIAYYDSMNKGYNLTSGGLNYIMSEKSKKKMSESKQNMSKETKQKISNNHADVSGEKNPMFGKTGENHPMFGRRGESHPMFGRTGENHPMFNGHHSEKSKKKMSESRKGERNWNYGKHHSKETIEKMSGENNSMYGKHHTEKAKELMRIARLKYWKNKRKKTREAIK